MSTTLHSHEKLWKGPQSVRSPAALGIQTCHQQPFQMNCNTSK
uniref:Uncharacterized protein n=1 Tax=Anguilla anguilla TaxID=7936 RepID=A0A0E9S6T9_ANGAN